VGDVEGMAAAALGILGNRDRWHAMSRAAAADARTRYALNDVVAHYERFYAAALG
jgi:glycosyltransferase involved in cell wall biosynthesis